MKRLCLLCRFVALLLVVSCAQTAPAAIPATATPKPTPTQIPGRADLYTAVHPPEHMAYIWWGWLQGQDAKGNRFDEFAELVIEFTIHNDVAPLGGNGLYLMLAYSEISGVGFYFGLQTDVKDPNILQMRGKGLIFSRWETRDLANARYVEEDGWTESSGHEGDFIGVRRSYAWGAGEYRVRMAPDESAPQDSDGVWFGLWITDLSTDETTWIGSLKFPLQDGKAVMQSPVYSTMEIYGDWIRPIDIPAWHVSIQRPLGDGVVAHGGRTGYAGLNGEITNADIRYDATNDIAHIKAGGATERRTEPGPVEFW
ncbi:MAG: hypothetical protein OXM03_00665 [Chloroflexota bacterium]|nr:hypothetical protein [Chloroflexota bacterium]